eukprot:gene2221-2933_t
MYSKLEATSGWSHFAQFTIAVVNKDPKKSKYSDTLHRFCKKEHDWGWKKFMELSKVLDGFTVADTLVIKAQVQVIKEKMCRPFRCLDSQYRRELVRVYLTNVEGICRRFVEEKRERLANLREDPASFRLFWESVMATERGKLSTERADVILKAVVKRFFNEKEVTSTLVMDALYSGCRALQARNGQVSENGICVSVERNEVHLGGDALATLERAANDVLPTYRDDRGSDDEFGRDSVERDEQWLAELGRRTVEMFVLSHLFANRMEVAYRESLALKRQEELLREEEAGRVEAGKASERSAAERERRARRRARRRERKEAEAKAKDDPDAPDPSEDEKDEEVEEPEKVAEEDEEEEPEAVEELAAGRVTPAPVVDVKPVVEESPVQPVQGKRKKNKNAKGAGKAEKPVAEKKISAGQSGGDAGLSSGEDEPDVKSRAEEYVPKTKAAEPLELSEEALAADQQEPNFESSSQFSEPTGLPEGKATGGRSQPSESGARSTRLDTSGSTENHAHHSRNNSSDLRAQRGDESSNRAVSEAAGGSNGNQHQGERYQTAEGSEMVAANSTGGYASAPASPSRPQARAYKSEEGSTEPTVPDNVSKEWLHQRVLYLEKLNWNDLNWPCNLIGFSRRVCRLAGMNAVGGPTVAPSSSVQSVASSVSNDDGRRTPPPPTVNDVSHGAPPSPAQEAANSDSRGKAAVGSSQPNNIVPDAGAPPVPRAAPRNEEPSAVAASDGSAAVSIASPSENHRGESSQPVNMGVQLLQAGAPTGEQRQGAQHSQPPLPQQHPQHRMASQDTRAPGMPPQPQSSVAYMQHNTATPPQVGKAGAGITGGDSPGFSEDFPHLNLINDLLDDFM